MFNCMRHKRLYRDHIGCFQGKQNQSLQLGPILNDTKQFHLEQKYFAVDTQSARRSAELKDMVLSFVNTTKFKIEDDAFHIRPEPEHLNNLL